MARSGDAGAGSQGGSGRQYRQLLLVALCVVGLIAAAFFAPVLDPAGVGGPGGAGGEDESGDGSDTGDEGQSSEGESEGEPGGGGSGETEPGDGDGSGGPGQGEGERRDDRGGDRGLVRDEGAPVPVPGGSSPPVDGCGVVVEDEPVPGAEIAVGVYLDRDPVEGARVWFNGESIGRTDASGEVTGRVPYSRALNVSVAVDGDRDCGFYHREFETDRESAAIDAAGLSARAVGFPTGPVLAATGDSPTAPAAIGGSLTSSPAQPADPNRTGTYSVRGTADLSVAGDRYPGETVTVRADVKGVPMRDAAVSVDGERVGRTDDDGTAEIQIPDDGTETVTVSVSRGDFAATGQIDVWHLELALDAEVFSIPGERAAVTATAGDAPTSGADVRVDGQRVGTTDRNGTASFVLPADPDAEVTVETERQSATRPLWPVYLPTVIALGFVLVAGSLSALAVAHSRGRRAGRRIGAVWAAVGVFLVAWIVGESRGALLALGGFAAVALILYRETVAAFVRAAAHLVANLGQALVAAAFRVTDVLERIADACLAAIDRLRAWIDSLPASLSGLASRLGGWLQSLPRRFLGALGSLRRRVGRRTAVGAVVALASVVASTAALGPIGLLGSLAVVCAVALALYFLGRRDAGADETGEGRPDGVGGSGGTGPTGAGSPGRPSLRELWRRFARWVSPSGWRQCTPGEISRAAIDRGLPEGPVRTLTSVFREVEYGDRSLSEARREAAADAFEELRDERTGREDQ